MWNFKKLQKTFAVLFLLCMIPLGMNAQTVKGTVSDESGEPIIGATVKVQGSNEGAITDFDGNYSVKAASDATLNFSYVGYVSQQVKVGGKTTINVTLTEDNTTLNDVVVIGYGTMKKKLVTGATVQVKGDDIAKLNTTNALEAMQSSTPGVQITSSSAQPGKGFKVYIRGIGTTGDSQPLYVIDGVAGGNLDDINPADIESIDILKDAASAAIYGARAANGVILVTTKQGKAGKIEITYNGAIGWSNAYKRPQLLNAQQYMTIMDEFSFNTSGAKMDWPAYVPQNILDNVAAGWKGTDWWDVFKNKNAVQHNHSITLTGGSDRSKFMMSYTYTGNEGIMGAEMASYYKRNTIRLNSDHVLYRVKDLDVITIGENISIGYRKSHDLAEDGMYWSYIHDLLQTSPLVPQYAENGDIYSYQKVNGKPGYGQGWNAQIFKNPWEALSKGGFNSLAESRSLNVGATAFMTVQPIKGLKWRAQFNYNWWSGSYRSYGEPRSPANGSAIVDSYSGSQNQNMGSNWSIENTITYDFPIFSGHKITAMVGQTFQSSAWGENIGGSNKAKYGEQLATLKGWDSAYLTNFKLANATDASLTGAPTDENYLASWFGRVSWDWNETYMATFTLRHDGSSVFNDGHRWGTFPSVSAGWVMTNEKFMEKTKSWLDFFKIRASWGQNGNCAIPAYQYLSTIAQSGAYNDNGYKFASDMTTSVAGTPITGAYANILPNYDLTWETSEQIDLGFDARFLNSRLGVTFDWYKKTTKDWLIGGPHVAIYGTNPAYINGGDVRNTGIELAISWNDRIGKDFSYNASVNFATNSNKVTRIANDNHYINGPSGVLSQGTEYVYRAEEGKPIGYFYGMSYSGIWQNQEQIDAARAAGKAVAATAQPGDCIWDDWNGDGKLTYTEGPDCDRHEIGNPNPDVTLGVNLGCAWKGFDFSVNGAGAFGMQIMRSYRSFGDNPYQNYDTTIFNRWHGENTSNDQPRISATGHNNTIWVSTRYMEDADYFKIKTVTLGYDFKHIWKACPFQQLRFYIQAQNLVTFTGYTGLDPEVGNSGGGTGWASGIDLGLYPTPRTFLVGASIKF
ncbi:TonB-dependent receptor [Prevotella sp. tf2-5]|uniref:SusC/RagA family TonB-linked outer membrane protein n=1 Tax=Prevotella sp. tf2-5 TaxID=1761889 RepID=UPI0008E71CC3|nr:TonB-dependent receptor [Prevotella sp. tf2-5]SFO43898.1 TonB-linked outer membrane protein, SusC/RagA family [Prevotella sp. tf2-5]